MADFNPRWSILAAVRGTGLLVDGKRLFTIAQCFEQSGQKVVHWGVIYAVLSESEAQICVACDRPDDSKIEYKSTVQPQAATLGRAYLDSRQAQFGEEPITFLGISTPWRKEKYTLLSLRQLATDYNDWIDSCISESQSSKTSSV